MVKQLINEEFITKIGRYKSKSPKSFGKEFFIVYIVATNNENIYDIKDVLKKYDARWFGGLGLWGWFVKDTNDPKINEKIRPCVNEINSNVGGGLRDGVFAAIDSVLEKLNSPDSIEGFDSGIGQDTTDLEKKVLDFKTELITTCRDNETFMKKIEPIIKFRRAHGHVFSFLNSLLIYLQKNDAVMVKSEKHWLDVNRRIKKGARPIYLWVPSGQQAFTSSQKQLIKKNYLERLGAKTVDDLNPGERERLDIMLKRINEPKGYKFSPSFYDYSDTEQIPNKEDMVGDPHAEISDDEVYGDVKGEETETIIEYINTMLSIIKKHGIEVKFSDNLGGALGVSKSGKIFLGKSAKRNLSFLNTTIHEFAHEMLHQKFLGIKNPKLRKYCLNLHFTREHAEQQASLCSWLVLKQLGIDFKPALNYSLVWGMDNANAVFIFDSISAVSNEITQMIVNELNGKDFETEEVYESFNRKHKGFSGEEIAEMIGFGDLYRRKMYGVLNENKNKFYGILEKIGRK